MLLTKNLTENEIFDDIFLYRSYLDEENASSHFDDLIKSLDWQQFAVNVFGKTYPQPRLCVFMGNTGLTYTYSRLTLSTVDWHPPVYRLKEKVSKDFNVDFNSVLLNLYRDGRDSNGWHADNEPELGLNPSLFSVSLGGSKPIHLRSSNVTTKIILNHGDGILFTGRSQHLTQHHIPKSKTYTEPRINLTFRKIVDLP